MPAERSSVHSASPAAGTTSHESRHAATGGAFNDAATERVERAEELASERTTASRVSRLAESERVVMAKKALVQKQQRKPKFKVRAYTRCRRCGRARSVYRRFGLCRICLREMVHAGEVPGMTKASW